MLLLPSKIFIQGLTIINILMIEDDYEIAQILTEYLNKFDIKVTSVEEPYIGLSHLTQNSFDLLILDLTLPGIDGLEVIPKIRKTSSIPIIVSSARDDITDKVIAMERGADDYMPKPYDPRELVTRIKTILRRTQNSEESKNNDSLFMLNTEARSVIFKNIMMELTAAEFEILSILIQHADSAISREQLLYDSEHIDDNSSIKNIDVIISRIRHKLSLIDPSHSYIKPVRGIGYLLTEKM
ncbi:MAG: Putative two-component regulator [uncultured Sulfurovum sp.]|uniref:Two-component regulator n=1 Tax=uncultured Sulfurovum sp. TaxID=269237 RepID=A0A6S6SNT6_9BACT|nr:MAG: Putative two-component regulator [uncultured Sulfurovum sp.]